MEPRQQWRGNGYQPVPLDMEAWGFNGAAPTMARKPAKSEIKALENIELQWSRANNGAETF